MIAGLLFMAGMRRSEVSVLLWGDVAEAAAGDGVLVTVRRGKTSPEPRGPGGPALRPQMVGLRFQSAARAAGVEPGVRRRRRYSGQTEIVVVP